MEITVNPTAWMWAFIGGIVLGLASTKLMVFNRRIAGISGILGGVLGGASAEPWRLAFVGGLFSTGVVATLLKPALIGLSPAAGSWPGLIVAGLLVGVGTQMGAGCTSGHGICGLSRMSSRSFIAVATFMAFGMATATAVRMAGGL